MIRQRSFEPIVERLRRPRRTERPQKGGGVGARIRESARRTRTHTRRREMPRRVRAVIRHQSPILFATADAERERGENSRLCADGRGRAELMGGTKMETAHPTGHGYSRGESGSQCVPGARSFIRHCRDHKQRDIARQTRSGEAARPREETASRCEKLINAGHTACYVRRSETTPLQPLPEGVPGPSG